jgi:3'-phosphoadenosine 5'-phosphosulfate sulfotransferase (PAPS reductase)/FAD synthetase
VPDEIEQVMRTGAAIAISISGGKDSQAMLAAVVATHRERGWPGPILAIHAHLGAAEWRQSLGHCRNLCARYGVELVEVSRRQGDLVQEIRDRMEKLRRDGSDSPPWPDAKNRYCTSDQKRGQIDTVIRSSPWPSATQRYCTADQKRDQLVKEHRKHDLIVSAIGMRAEESPARRKRPVVSIQKRITAKAYRDMNIAEAISHASSGQRLAVDWLPIHDWTEAEVWEACGSSSEDVARRREIYAAGRTEEALDGWQAHPAYVFGNQRLSCVFCILASKSDLVNGARHNPDLFREYVAIERESGFTFQHGRSLESLAVEAGVSLTGGARW